MKQMSLASGGFDKYGKVTRRAAFLAQMDQVVPWAELCELIEPYYPKGEAGRPPVPLQRMLRLHFLQHWFNLSDPGLEETLLDSASMREFAGIDLGVEPVPDETTVCKFRHLLERHSLGEQIFRRVGQVLVERGFKLSSGTIVDATLIAAPTSTKNASGERDPEMGTTKKGNQWLYGMKAHVGVDAKSKLIHSVVATAGNEPDGKVIKQLLHGREHNVWGDKAYVGLSRVIGSRAPKARDQTLLRATSTKPLNPMQEHFNTLRSQIRCRVEHVFAVIKCVFGFAKLRYRGLRKNAHRLMVAAALHNLYVVRHQLAR